MIEVCAFLLEGLLMVTHVSFRNISDVLSFTFIIYLTQQNSSRFEDDPFSYITGSKNSTSSIMFVCVCVGGGGGGLRQICHKESLP